MTKESLSAIAKKLGVPVESLTKGNKPLLDKYLAEKENKPSKPG